MAQNGTLWIGVTKEVNFTSHDGWQPLEGRIQLVLRPSSGPVGWRASVTRASTVGWPWGLSSPRQSGWDRDLDLKPEHHPLPRPPQVHSATGQKSAGVGGEGQPEQCYLLISRELLMESGSPTNDGEKPVPVSRYRARGAGPQHGEASIWDGPARPPSTECKTARSEQLRQEPPGHLLDQSP